MIDKTMSINNINRTGGSTRITSIDSLRAFALFGILLVHVCSGMGSGTTCYNPFLIDTICNFGCGIIFQGRCALIFNVLFGISFYIILRKPNYSSSKFVWRCFLLFIIGLVNQYFYNSDALMWYGLCGMALVSVRNFSNRKLIYFIAVLYCLSFIIQTFHLGNMLSDVLPPFVRYRKETTELGFLLSYPFGILQYFVGVLNSGIFRTLANFAFGYLLGRIGFVERWDKQITSKYVWVSLLSYILLYIPKLLISYKQGLCVPEIIQNVLFTTANLSGAAFYTFFFIWVYNNVKPIHSFLRWLENYGKCGLTNYTMQGIIGNIIFFHFGLSWFDCHFIFIFFGAIAFYFLQCWFCQIWLTHFNNGPMEYLWRCATERKMLQFRKTRS